MGSSSSSSSSSSSFLCDVSVFMMNGDIITLHGIDTNRDNVDLLKQKLNLQLTAEEAVPHTHMRLFLGREELSDVKRTLGSYFTPGHEPASAGITLHLVISPPPKELKVTVVLVNTHAILERCGGDEIAERTAFVENSFFPVQMHMSLLSCVTLEDLQRKVNEELALRTK